MYKFIISMKKCFVWILVQLDIIFFIKKNLQLLNFSLCNQQVIQPFLLIIRTLYTFFKSSFNLRRLFIIPLVSSICACLPPVFSGVRVTRSVVLYVCFVDRCLYFFFWSLWCLFFFDIRILITPLVSSNCTCILCDILHTWDTYSFLRERGTTNKTYFQFLLTIFYMV